MHLHTRVYELFVCTETQTRQAEDQFRVSTKT